MLEVSRGKIPYHVLRCAGERPRTSLTKAAGLESNVAIGSLANSLEVWGKAIVIKAREATGTKMRQVIRPAVRAAGPLCTDGLLCGSLWLGQCFTYGIKLDGTGFH